MATRDAEEFGSVVDHLVGRACERSLATNSIKFRFDTEVDPKGMRYIWIEPPWTLYRGDSIVTSSGDYSDDTFRAWSRHFEALNRTTFVGWEGRDDGTIFKFSGECTIFVPAGYANREENGWFDHWYASEKSLRGESAGSVMPPAPRRER